MCLVVRCNKAQRGRLCSAGTVTVEKKYRKSIVQLIIVCFAKRSISYKNIKQTWHPCSWLTYGGKKVQQGTAFSIFLAKVWNVFRSVAVPLLVHKKIGKEKLKSKSYIPDLEHGFHSKEHCFRDAHTNQAAMICCLLQDIESGKRLMNTGEEGWRLGNRFDPSRSGSPLGTDQGAGQLQPRCDSSSFGFLCHHVCMFCVTSDS